MKNEIDERCKFAQELKKLVRKHASVEDPIGLYSIVASLEWAKFEVLSKIKNFEETGKW
jgi:hypothetical protein